MDHARRLALLETVTLAVADEIARHDPTEPVAWTRWPDVARLVGHLGGVHRWAAEVVRAGEPVSQPADRPAPADAQRWFLDGRSVLLDALRASDPESPSWVLAGPDRTVGFWWRRMVFETTKHLTDLRAAGGDPWRIADELTTPDYADGIDELASVFLARSRPNLADLPAPVRLVAADAERSWTFTTDWDVLADAAVDAAEVRARTGDLALLVWQRADPFDGSGRFDVRGSEDDVWAFLTAPIHS